MAFVLALAAPAAADDPTQPRDITVAAGATASFTGGASGASFFQWYRVGSPDTLLTTDTSSQGTSTYSFTASDADDGARFYVKYLAGGKFVSSSVATLNVGDGHVVIMQSPTDASVLAGRPADFSVTAKGQTPYTFRWERSTDGGGTWTAIAGATTSALRLRPTVDDDGTLLRAVVGNANGPEATSATARLTVQPLSGTGEPVAHASLEWGLNGIYQGGNPAGNNCNYFAAGVNAVTFADRLGSVQIVHRSGDRRVSVSPGTMCSPDDGTQLGQRALFKDGTGTANPATGEATIQWTGAFTANAYGGLVPWYLKDPKLTVGADGRGTLTAIAGGEGADRDDPNHPFELQPRPVTVATFSDVQVTAAGISVRPDYKGVDYFPLVGGVRSGTSAIPADVKAGNPNWGAWPTTFVDFQYETELSTYWHTSGLSADPDKPPVAFDVQFAAAPAVAEVPRLLTDPKLSAVLPLIEGRNESVHVDVAAATTLQWQRSTSAAGPWTDVAGATGDTLALTALTSAWNNSYVRLKADNAAGTVTSAATRLTTKAAAPVAYTAHPAATGLTIAGSRFEFTATATGNPAPLVENYGVEISHDGGATWAPVAGATWSSNRYTVPSLALADDGALLRGTARNRDGETAASNPIAVTVVPATGGPQLAVLPNGPLNPAVATTLTVVGTGFAIPDAEQIAGQTWSYSLDVGLFDRETWQPGQTGTRSWLATSSSTSGGQLYQGRMQSSGGWFSVTMTVPANKLQVGHFQGVGAFLRQTNNSNSSQSTFANRALDAWAGVAVTDQAVAAFTAQPADVSGSAGDSAVFSAPVVGAPEPTVQWQRRGAGDTGWADLAGETEPTLTRVLSTDDDGAQFRALATNPLGTTTSAPARVTVARPGDGTTPSGGGGSSATAPGTAPTEPAAADAPPTPGASAPAPSTSPSVSGAAAGITGRSAVRVGRTGVAKVGFVACPAGASCRVTAPRFVTVRIEGKAFRARVVVGRSVRAGRSASVSLRLPSAAVRRLHGHAAKAAVKVKVTRDGRIVTRTVRTTLRAA
jgi:hypothetical protein